ncbi:hypothetical protein [Glycomyces albidus]|uniref:PH domain-containing protein n=1 Tax=Glycomyces albidus TaxID=2656774 RepID=A0A6L5G4Q4_9ACTN|nr:hypothetical protein [Glycomyces albidus]MQM24608.1 hypothetical protein [Glycomyces albidus]
MMPPQDSREETAVADRLRPHDLVLFAVAIALVAALPWMLASAGSEPVEYRDHQTGQDRTAPAWVGVLVFAVPLLAWSAMKAWNLFAGPAAATLGPGGLRLYEEVGGLYLRRDVPDVDVPWSEVHRIVLWRRRIRWLGFVPGWTTQVGVEKTGDWYQVSRKEPTARELASREHRPDGSPIRLGSMLSARSVRLTPAAARRLAAAVAKYAPSVAFVDERIAGESRAVEPVDRRPRN